MVVIRADAPRSRWLSGPTGPQILRTVAGVRPATKDSYGAFHDVSERLVPVGVNTSIKENEDGPALRANYFTLQDRAIGTAYAAFAFHIAKLGDDEVAVLPPSANISGREARRNLNHRRDTIVNVFGRPVVRELTGGQNTSHRALEYNNVSVELALQAAVDLRDIDDPLIGYRFGDSVVTWMQAVEGAELRALTNVFGYQVGIERVTQELRSGFHLRRTDAMGNRLRLASHERRRKEKQKRMWERAIEKRGYERFLRHADPNMYDTIDIIGVPVMTPVQGLKPAMAHHWNGLVPSREFPKVDVRRGSKDPRYVVTCRGVPAVDPLEVEVAAPYIREMRVQSPVGHSEWAGTSRGDHHHWSAPEIAFAHTVAHVVNERGSYDVRFNDEQLDMAIKRSVPLRIPNMPFVIPTQEMADFVHRLRYQTGVAHVREDGRVQIRSLNQGLMDVLIGERVRQRGVRECFVMDPRELPAGEDPQSYLLQITSVG